METIAELIQCSICLETFTDPRMLPCIHTFCLKCLQQTVLNRDEKQPKDRLPCPICRTEFVIPPQGVEGFQKNFFMHRLKEITEITKPSEKSCEMCLESKENDEDQVLPADVYCIQCHKNFCKRCSKSHKIFVEFKEHQLVPLGTEITEKMIKMISHPSCPRHKTEQAKMYCSDCKKVICMVCFAENHQTHKCSGVEKVGNTSREELKIVVSEVETCLSEWLTKMQKCTDEKANFQKNVENIEETVINRKNEVIALIEKCSKSLLEELASIRQTRMKEIQNRIDEHERQRVIIESFKIYCKQMGAKGTNIELCQVVPTLKRRAEDIQQTHRTLCQQSPELIQLHFEETNFDEGSKSKNVIGRIKEFIRLSGKLNIPSSSVVQGVAKLDNKICVLCTKPNRIRIFHDQDSFDQQMEIELEQIEKPCDIASSEKSKCLYLSGYNDSRIWRVSIDDRRVTEWLNRVGKTLDRLSVTSEDNVLVLVRCNPFEVEIYSSNAAIVCQFSLPSNIRNAQQVIQKPNGEFIISHREVTDGETNWVISRLTSDGQTVIERFHPKVKSQELNSPFDLALDSDNNRVFVADCNNDRVMMIDSNSLDLLKIPLTKEENGISWPCGLFYDRTERNKQLIVGHSLNKVEVYEIGYREVIN